MAMWCCPVGEGERIDLRDVHDLNDLQVIVPEHADTSSRLETDAEQAFIERTRSRHSSYIVVNNADSKQAFIEKTEERFKASVKRNFEADIKRDARNKNLGLYLDNIDGLMINKISDGLIKKRNDEVGEDLAMRAGDFIVSVNGEKRSRKKMLALLETEETLHFELIRPKMFEVHLNRASSGLGLGLRFVLSSAGQSLVVRRVEGGSIESWNTSNPEEAVQVGDRILKATDGATGMSFGTSAADMAAGLQKSERILLLVAQRPLRSQQPSLSGSA